MRVPRNSGEAEESFRVTTRKTIVLAVVLAVLCAGYYGVHWLDARRTVEEAAAKRLFDFDVDRLASLQIVRADGTTVGAVQTGDGAWDITQPYDHIVPNQNVWGRLSNAWAHLANERTFGERDLAVYGLDNPTLTVTGTTEDGHMTTIAFGGTEPLQTGRYAHTDGVGVFLVKETAFRELDRPLQDLRARHLVQVGEAGVTQLAFSFLREAEDGGEVLEPGRKPVEPSVAMRVEKSGLAWNMMEPVEAPADQQAVEQLAQGLQFATAKNFVDVPESYEDYGLDPPRARIVVSSEAVDGPQILYLGDADASTAGGAIWAKKHGNPSVFQVGGELLALLPTEPDSFRERRLLTRELEGLQSLELEYRGGVIRLINDPGGAWQMVEPFADDTDQTQVSSYLAVLKSARGSSFPEVSAAEAGVIAPVYTIRLHFADETREIRIGAPHENGPLPAHYVQLDFGAISVMPDVLRNALVREAFEFRDKALMKFNADQARRLRMTLDGREVVLEKQLGQWRAIVPQGAVLESQADALAILKALAEAKASGLEFTADEAAGADLGKFGLDAPVFTAVVELADDEGGEAVVGPLRLGAVSAAESQERWVVTEDRPEVFRARQALLDTIRDAFRGIRVPASQEG